MNDSVAWDPPLIILQLKGVHDPAQSIVVSLEVADCCLLLFGVGEVTPFHDRYASSEWSHRTLVRGESGELLYCFHWSYVEETLEPLPT